MKELTVFEFQGHRIRIIEHNGEPWFIDNEICKVLGITNAKDAVSRLSEHQKSGVNIADRHGRVQKTNIISEGGLRRLLSQCRSPKAIEMAKALGLEMETFFHASKEQHTLAIISAAFLHIEQKTQYHVNGYRIDLYFPEYRIAVECDENGHGKYGAGKEAERQCFIEDALGCTFIRYNPDENGFNIGIVINKIMRAMVDA